MTPEECPELFGGILHKISQRIENYGKQHGNTEIPYYRLRRDDAESSNNEVHGGQTTRF